MFDVKKYSIFSFSVDLSKPSFAVSPRRVKLLQNAICYNQGRMAQYSYLAGEGHKKLKEAFCSKEDVQTLAERKKELLSLLSYDLDDILAENFKYLKMGFNSKRYVDPLDVRICVKVCHDRNIHDYFRDGLNIHINYELEKNTGFHEVYKHGKSYWCNNLPRAVVKEGYKNPRLDHDKAVRYRRGFGSLTKEDRNWMDCWGSLDSDGGEYLATRTSCYKSTLIIPMTLIGNQLTPEFKERFGIQRSSEKSPVYGFLCLDHPRVNFFCKEDIDFGYMFADILSLYFIDRLKYTTKSKTFQKIETLTTGVSNV